MNYFELLGLPQQFQLYAADIRSAFMQCRSQASDGDAEQKLNQAYQIISTASERAAYLLELHGIAIDKSGTSQVPQTVLFEQFELRESLDNAKDIAQLELLEQDFDVRHQQAISDFEQAWQLLDSKTQTGSDECIAAYFSLLYSEKLIHEVKEHIFNASD